MNTIVVAVLKSSVIRNTRPARFDRSPVTDNVLPSTPSAASRGLDASRVIGWSKEGS
jgi:hypothetical protein